MVLFGSTSHFCYLPRVASTPETSAPPGSALAPPAQPSAQAGLVYGLAAYTCWGVIPFYFRALAAVPPLTILYHRILWSALFIGLVVTVRREWKPILEAMRSRRNLTMLSAGAVLIALNWLIFIYAVATHQLLQGSLGYFINPLLSIALGMVFLGERLRRWQWLAVLVALAAVANLAVRSAGFPWISVSLAASFGLYGLVRKKVNINSLHGLFVESTLLLPPAVVMLCVTRPDKIAGSDLFLLSMAGPVTAIPLLCFGAALRRLRLSTMGFLQYVGPTLQFLVAAFAFHERLDPAKLGSFVLIWLAIAIYVLDSWLNREPQPVADEPE
jgi:chloramphenicol-sensitive protein RarD